MLVGFLPLTKKQLLLDHYFNFVIDFDKQPNIGISFLKSWIRHMSIVKEVW